MPQEITLENSVWNYALMINFHIQKLFSVKHDNIDWTNVLRQQLIILKSQNYNCDISKVNSNVTSVVND